MDRSVYSVIFRKVLGLQLAGSVPIRMVRLLADDRKNDVVRLHRAGPQVTLDFLDERRRTGLERTLHHGLTVMWSTCHNGDTPGHLSNIVIAGHALCHSSSPGTLLSPPRGFCIYSLVPKCVGMRC